jgi:hypothetical protein
MAAPKGQKNPQNILPNKTVATVVRRVASAKPTIIFLDAIKVRNPTSGFARRNHLLSRA